jgi:hypothetical protein
MIDVISELNKLVEDESFSIDSRNELKRFAAVLQHAAFWTLAEYSATVADLNQTRSATIKMLSRMREEIVDAEKIGKINAIIDDIASRLKGDDSSR